MAAPSDRALTAAPAASSAPPSRSSFAQLGLPAISASCLRVAAIRAEEARHFRHDPASALVFDFYAEKLAGGMRVEQAHHVFRKAATSRRAAAAPPADEAKAEQAAAASSDATFAAADSSSAVAAASSAASAAALAADVHAQSHSAPEQLVRGRFIDDAITEHVQRDSVTQVVMLGAGLDARAYRMESLRGARVYELDAAEVLRYKAALLEADAPRASEVVRIAVDLGVMGEAVGVSKTALREKGRRSAQLEEKEAAGSCPPAASVAPRPPPWLFALLATSFDPALPTLWVAEGLLMYLGPKQVGNLLSWIAHVAVTATAKTAVDAAAPSPSPSSGARHYLVADVMNEQVVRSRLRWYRFFRWGAAREGGAPTAIQPFLRANGWITLADESGRPELHPIGRSGLSYNRYTADPLLDSTTFPQQPPMLLESYLVRAQVHVESSKLKGGRANELEDA